MILSENVSDEKIFLFFSLLGNSIPYLVRLSGLRRMMFLIGVLPNFLTIIWASKWSVRNTASGAEMNNYSNFLQKFCTLLLVLPPK